MVEGVDERQCGCTIESTAVVEGGCDIYGGFIDIWDTEVDFSHDGQSIS